MPSTSTDRLNGLSTSVAIKPPCKVATTANITLSGEQTIDGVAVVSGDRVLVKDQTDATENGIYVVDTTAWDRAKDFDGNRDVVQGTIVLVRPASDDTLFWEVTSANPIVIGTSNITFEAADPGLLGLEDEDGAENGAGMVGFGVDNDYAAGTVGWALKRKSSRVIHKGFAYDYSTTTTVVYDGSTGDGLHRHFGQIAEGLDGRLHLVYGRSPTHGLTAGQTAWYRTSNDGGSTWSAESEVIPADVLLDQRSLSMCVTPTGRILLLYAAVPADSSTPVVFKLRYSDDNGATWTQGTNITSINFTYARAYGRVKLIPGDSSSTYRLAWTPYFRSGSGPATYRVSSWTSEDDGLTWVEGAAIVDNTAGENECEMVAINAKMWFAVTRGATGLTLYKTTDAGGTWTSLGIVPGTVSDSWVAPTLDKFEKDGSWFLALSYCNRATDKLQWRVAAVAAAMTSASAFGSEIDVATDMVNASGYQCPVVKPDGCLYVDGGVGYIEFKEYTGFVYTQVRFVRIDLLALVTSTYLSLTVASGAVTIPGNSLERIIALDTESAAASDDLDTINGGRWGSVYVFKNPQTTNTRDVTLKNGTGNLDLFNDFRLNTSDSAIALLKTGTKWVELARTNDHTEASIVIASDAITVPSCREVRYFLIDTEAAAATDNLTTINGGLDGQIIILMSATSSRDPTIAEGGNISLDAAGSFTLSNVADTITLLKRGSTWYEIARSDNA